MNKKILLINFVFFLAFYLVGDILFSNFFYKYKVGYKCYKHSKNNSFYELDKNCFAKMRLIGSIDSYNVYTNAHGDRYSGEKKLKEINQNVFFFGDSQTFGVGSDWKDTFVGIVENKQNNYKVHNFGVPSYSPTVYNYKLKSVIEKRNIKPKKIFIVLDLTDVGDESEKWRKEEDEQTPYTASKFVRSEKVSKLKKFKRDNLKGSRLIANYLRETSRKIRRRLKDENEIKNEYKPVNGNPSGGFVYTNFDKLTGCKTDLKKTHFWTCGGVEVGLKKIEKNLIEIGKISKNLNSDFYIIIFPWPDTLNFGQTVFNWEKYVESLCKISSCSSVINLFPDFEEIKTKREDWLTYLYLTNDIHLTPQGNKIVGNKILEIAFGVSK